MPKLYLLGYLVDFGICLCYKNFMNLKKIVADFAEIDESKVLLVPNKELGDFCVPCFEFAKKAGKSPNEIAEEWKEYLFQKENHMISEIRVVNGYLNFFINKTLFAKQIIAKESFDFDFSETGKGKTVCIDYCSANLAKYLHIGHMSTTFIGESLRRIYSAMGFNVIRINYLGDYGTPFGKMVVAVQLWGSVEEIIKKGVDEIQSLYVKFNQNETEELLERARFASKQIENQTGEEYEIYRTIIKISIQECKRIMDLIEIDFDDWRGESYYNNRLESALDELRYHNISQIGENGSEIVDLNSVNKGIAIVKRSDGGSVYLTRDICAVQDRFDLYSFDEMLYVVAVQQKLHFEQLKQICTMLEKPYANRLKHISFGMFSTPEGKIASRKGKQALFVDIFAQALEKAKNILELKNLTYEDKEKVAKKVALGAIAYSILRIERNKDKIFDLETAINFDGETAPYLQYTYARTCSLIRKFEELNVADGAGSDNDLDAVFTENYALFEKINNLSEVIKEAQASCEPSIISHHIMGLAQDFNSFYTNVKILDANNPERTKDLMKVVKLVHSALAFAMPLVLVEPIQEM